MQITDSVLLKSVSYSNNVTSVNLCDCLSDQLTEQGLIDLAKSCPKLVHINLAKYVNNIFLQTLFIYWSIFIGAHVLK